MSVTITPTYMIMGEFDTRNRYLRESSSSPTDFVAASGVSLAANYVTSSGGNALVFWRWRVGAAEFVGGATNSYGGVPPAVADTSTDIAL